MANTGKSKAVADELANKKGALQLKRVQTDDGFKIENDSVFDFTGQQLADVMAAIEEQKNQADPLQGAFDRTSKNTADMQARTVAYLREKQRREHAALADATAARQRVSSKRANPPAITSRLRLGTLS